MKQVDELSPEAQGVGAVNVVHFRGSRLRGHNTDVFGIKKTLEEQRYRVAGQSALLLGAGGAALAVAYALGQGRAREVFILNRSRGRALTLARRLTRLFPKTRFVVPGRGAADFSSVSLYINATPLGMKGFPNETLLPTELNPDALAFDLVYRPEKTAFLKVASRKGLRTVGGLDMLIWKRLLPGNIWFRNRF